MENAFCFLRKSMVGIGGLLMVAIAVSGCVISPQPGDLAGSNVSGFATQPSALIRVDAFNFRIGAYEVIGTTTADSSALVSAGSLCADSPALYYYSASVTFNEGDLDHSFFPDPAGRLQVTEVFSGGGTQVLFASSRPDALYCMLSNVTPGCSFYTVAYWVCGFQLGEIPIHFLG